MRTFAVDKVDLATARMKPLERATAIPSLLKNAARIEQVYQSNAKLVIATDASPLVQMVHDAFYDHRPITISPDAVWFTIGQGFATHVNLNAEKLRKRFVQHEGKVKLVVDRPDFLLGQTNPWPEAFAAFSDQVAGHVGKLRDLVVADFSTTGPVERAATEVLVMDTFQAYFEYEMRCGCGLPRITVTGTPDDWRSIKKRAQHLSEYGLESWIDTLVPVIDRIIATVEGADETAFWQSFFHYQTSSMGEALTGWLNVLYPYLLDWQTRKPTVANPHMAHWQKNFALPPKQWKTMPGPPLSHIPGGLASAPVRVTDVPSGQVFDMRFVAGMFGVVEADDGTLSPEFGWAITYDR
ncbi:MAG: DUF4419 domain-containing protein [Kofleriaceae bacterium]